VHHRPGDARRLVGQRHHKNHVAALATKHLDVAKYAAEAAVVACDLVRIEHEQPYKAIIEVAENRK
jgi:hypothetical protein